MAELEAQRTLVKSPPELWAELSNPESLARRLSGFGEIRITRVVPETIVAWEGERASGTVELESAGWGTRVLLRASAGAEEPKLAARDRITAVIEPEPDPVPASAAERSAARVARRAHAAQDAGVGAPAAPHPRPAPQAPPRTEPAPPTEATPTRRPGFFARLFGRRRARRAAAAAAGVPVETAPGVDAVPPPIAAAAPVDRRPPEPLAPEQAMALLSGVLDDLGAAHHRPFSRK